MRWRSEKEFVLRVDGGAAVNDLLVQLQVGEGALLCHWCSCRWGVVRVACVTGALMQCGVTVALVGPCRRSHIDGAVHA